MKRAILLFSVCLGGELLASALMYRLVMTDQVYLSMLGLDPTGPTADRILSNVRGWSLAMHALAPITLLARTGGAALLVQLLLIGLRARHPLLPVLTASLWAQLVLVAGRTARATSLALLQPGARTVDALTEPFLPAGAFLRIPGEWPPSIHAIEQASLLVIPWCIVFAVALRDGQRIRAPVAVCAVVASAVIVGAIRWAGWTYLTRIEVLSGAL